MVDRWRRRTAGLGGLLAGLVGGLVLWAGRDGVLSLFAGAVFGILYALSAPVERDTALDRAVTAAVLAISTWVGLDLVALPLVTTGTPAWSVASAAPLLTDLLLWVATGGFVGLLAGPTTRAVRALSGPPSRRYRPSPTKVVIVGGGITGLAAARRLEELFGPDPSVRLTLVDATGVTLWTPLLAEVVGGGLEPTHASVPLRTALRRTRVVRATATDVDTGARRVSLGDVPELPSPRRQTSPYFADGGVDDRPGMVRSDGGGGDRLPYDHLVLAVGTVPATGGVPGVTDHTYECRTVADAVRLREHVVDCIERASVTATPSKRRRLLTFVVVGAGLAGAQLAGHLADFVHATAATYPSVPTGEVRVVVVHDDDRILPELDETLSTVAFDRLRDRDVELELDTAVTAVTEQTVALSTGETVRAETVVWTAGRRPVGIVDQSPLPRTDGRVEVDHTLSVPGLPGVWAAGSCAAATDPTTGERYPSTAGHAVRAGRTAAENVHARVTGSETGRYHDEPTGTLATVGYREAVTEVAGRPVDGRFAWLLWRAAALSDLPGTDRRLRLLSTWLVDLWFPPDITGTLGVGDADA